jgi:hypothetical protein
MHLGEQLGNPLDLIDDDPITKPVRDQFLEEARARQEIVMGLRFQQVGIQGLGKTGLHPARLARPSRPEKEEALLLWN